jgi:hypothetical protein
MDQAKAHAHLAEFEEALTDTERSVQRSAGEPQATSPSRKRRRLDAAQSASWISTAVPLATCIMIWGVEGGPSTHIPWLTVLHDAVGTAASAWTALQIVLKGLALHRGRREIAKASWPHPGLLALCALMTLQPTLAIASSMLHGSRVTIFGVHIPSVLPVSPKVAGMVDQLHLFNGLILLSVIAVQVSLTFHAFMTYRALSHPEP